MPQGSGVHAKTTKPRRCSSCQSAIVSVGRAAGAVAAGRLGGIEFQALHRDLFVAVHAIAVVPGFDALHAGLVALHLPPTISDATREGIECDTTCLYRWYPYL